MKGIFCKFRSSRREVFCKTGALRNFAKFTGKHQCHSLFLMKLLAKKKLIITDQTSPFEKSLNLITAEASNIKDSILFNGNLKDEMKYHRTLIIFIPFAFDR